MHWRNQIFCVCVCSRNCWRDSFCQIAFIKDMEVFLRFSRAQTTFAEPCSDSSTNILSMQSIDCWGFLCSFLLALLLWLRQTMLCLIVYGVGSSKLVKSFVTFHLLFKASIDQTILLFVLLSRTWEKHHLIIVVANTQSTNSILAAPARYLYACKGPINLQRQVVQNHFFSATKRDSLFLSFLLSIKSCVCIFPRETGLVWK